MMKKNKSSVVSIGYMMVVLLLLSISFINESHAQSDKLSTVDQYAKTHPDHPIVKYYLFDTKNVIAATALKSMYLLEQPNKFSQTEIEQLQSGIDNVLRITKRIDELVLEGIAYDRAAKAALKQQENNSDNATLNQASPANANGVPILTIPAQ